MACHTVLVTCQAWFNRTSPLPPGPVGYGEIYTDGDKCRSGGGKHTSLLSDNATASPAASTTTITSEVNDNTPSFEFPYYHAQNVDEDIPVGTSLLTVKATDPDSGNNGEISYSVSQDHYFAVDSNGIISSNRRLDADSYDAYYEFMVMAKDKGEPARTGTSVVRLYTENKNDEDPRFTQQVYMLI